jgi:hypothetical protein
MDKSPLTTGPIHTRPKIAGSLGEQLLRLANIASYHSPSEASDPAKKPRPSLLARRAIPSPSEACENWKFWTSF